MSGARAVVHHNHVTRDIKRKGLCPACDKYWASAADKHRHNFELDARTGWHCRCGESRPLDYKGEPAPQTPKQELAAIIYDRWHGYGYNPEGAAEAILAAGYTKQRQVTMPAELEALPEGSLILSRSPYPRYAGTVWRVSSGRVIEKVGREAEGVTPFGYFQDPLPATVIYSPAVG